MRFIIEVNTGEQPLVTIGERLPIPTSRLDASTTEWMSEDGEFHFGKYVRVVAAAKDEDNLGNLTDKYPELFV